MLLPPPAYFRVKNYGASLMLAAMFFCIQFLNAQQGGPGPLWTSGINFGTNDPEVEDSWAFDAVEMANGDIVAVGYVEIAGIRYPGYAVVNKQGALVTSNIYNTGGGGAFNQVANTADGGCIMVGFKGTQAFMVKISSTYTQVWSQQFDLSFTLTIPPNVGAILTGSARLTSISVAPSGVLALTGFFRRQRINGQDPPIEPGYGFLLTRNADGSALSQALLEESNGAIVDSKIITVNGVDWMIYTGTEDQGDGAWNLGCIYQLAPMKKIRMPMTYYRQDSPLKTTQSEIMTS